MKIILFGANGLIGTNLFKCLTKKSDYFIYLPIRSKDKLNRYYKNLKNKKILEFARFDELENLKSMITQINPDLIINCAGITKHNPNINNISEVLFLNSIFPKRLAQICTLLGIRLIHLSTDCIFSGNTGMYKENSIPDAKDIYGMTKSLGEIDKEPHLTIRTSTIGHEVGTSKGLLNWFLTQKKCYGYTNAIFSGPTTLELSKIIREIIIPRQDLKGIMNISSKPIDKFSLLKIIKKIYGLQTLIEPNDQFKINRSLDSSRFQELTNYTLKSWESMIGEMYSERNSFI